MIKLFETKKEAQSEARKMIGYIIKIEKYNDNYIIKCNVKKFLRENGFVN